VTDLRTQLQTTLGAAYTLERELGGGGMSRVFVARDNALGRDVVIKVLSPELAASLSAERFTREIKLAAALQEPHIVPVLAAGMTNDGLPYYTMPFVRGDSLRARIASGRVPFDEARAILRNVAQALAYAHAQGIVHRDIKPENVLLSSGTAVVTDFGIAKALAASKTAAPGGTITQVGTSLGTPAYVAPEQAAGDDVDARADLYAWGVMAYELFTGQHPFHTRTTAQQLIAAHIAEAPAPLLEALDASAKRDPAVRAFATVVMQCLEKQPSARPASAAAVLTAMDDVTRSGSTVAPTHSRSRVVAVAVVVVALVAGGATYLGTRAPAAAPTLAPKRVVIASFENKSGDASLDPLGAMAADWIARGLVGTGIVDVGGTSADLASRGVASRAAPGESPLQTLARDANAGIVISGAYYRQGDSVLFQADFTDANAKSLVQTVGPISALATAPLLGVERLRQRVIAGLAPMVDSMLTSQASLIAQPPTIEAYREFLQGEALYYTNEQEAAQHFLRAAAQDTTYVLPLLRALIVLNNNGDFVRTDSIKRVLGLRRGQLTPFEQAYFDYASNDCTTDAECLRATGTMTRLTPNSQFTAYLHAIVLRWANQPGATDSILRQLDPKSGELRGRIFLPHHHAQALHTLGLYAREFEVGVVGRAQYPNRLFLAMSEVRPLIALGRLDEANRAIDSMFAYAPDKSASALWYAVQAIYEFRWHGHAAAATALEARLLRRMATPPPVTEQTVRDPRELRGQLELLAATRQWPALEALTTNVLRLDRVNIPALRLQGVALAMQGKRAQALAVDSLLASTTVLERPADQCATGRSGACRRTARAYIAAALGDKARAVSLLEFRAFNDITFDHYDLIGEWLRDYPPFQEYIRPKG